MGKILALTLCVICMQTTLAAYRLKYSTTVDVIDDSGKVTGKKTLKAGTSFVLPDSAAGEPFASDLSSSASSKSLSSRKGKLKVSDISPTMWKNTHPDHTVFRAVMKLGTYYNMSFVEKKKTHWNVIINACNKDEQGDEIIWGYAARTSPVGKKIAKLLGDGNEHLALVMISGTKKEFEEDMAFIEDFEITDIKSASEE